MLSPMFFCVIIFMRIILTDMPVNVKYIITQNGPRNYFHFPRRFLLTRQYRVSYIPCMMTLQQIGERVKRYRKRAMLTQDELAAQTGISQTTISDIEHGKATMDIVELYNICNACACSTHDIIGEDYDGRIRSEFTEVSRFTENGYEYITFKRPKK